MSACAASDPVAGEVPGQRAIAELELVDAVNCVSDPPAATLSGGLSEDVERRESADVSRDPAVPGSAASAVDEQDLQRALEDALSANTDRRAQTAHPPVVGEEPLNRSANAADSGAESVGPDDRLTTPPTDRAAPDPVASAERADPAAAPSADLADRESPAIEVEDVPTGWRGVAGRLLGRARRVLRGDDPADAAPTERRTARKSGDTSAQSTTARRKRTASAKPRARRAPASAPKRGLWGRLLAGVGLAAPAKPEATRARKPATARSAPRKPRAQRSARQTVKTGLVARTLARFGFGADPAHNADVESDAVKSDTPARAKRAPTRKTATRRKPTAPRAKNPASTPEPAWRRAWRRVFGRS